MATASFFKLQPNPTGEPTFVESFLTPEECRTIIQTGERDIELAAGRTENHQVNEQLRKSDIGWLSPEGEMRWLFDRIRECVMQINGNWFRYELIGYEGIQFTRYAYVAGQSDYYSSHRDTVMLPGGTVRKLSFTIQLSDPSAYEGGDVVLYNSLIDTIKLSRGVGSISFFPSYVIHEVMPVTRGVRHSLVGWACGPAFV